MAHLGTPELRPKNPGGGYQREACFPLPTSLQELLDSFEEFDPEAFPEPLPEAWEGAAERPAMATVLVPLAMAAHSA